MKLETTSTSEPCDFEVFITLDKPRLLRCNAASRSRMKKVSGYDFPNIPWNSLTGQDAVRLLILFLYVTAAEAEPKVEPECICRAVTVDSILPILATIKGALNAGRN